MTIREFAKLCGVSPATASRFFTGRGGGNGLCTAGIVSRQEKNKSAHHRDFAGFWTMCFAGPDGASAS